MDLDASAKFENRQTHFCRLSSKQSGGPAGRHGQGTLLCYFKICIYHEHPNAEFSAICDSNFERAKAWALKFNLTGSAVYTDHDEMLAKADIGEPYSAYYRLNDIKWVATDLRLGRPNPRSSGFWGTIVLMFCAGCLMMRLEFRKGGIATMENGWITPNTNPNVNDMKLNITGTKGMFNIDPTAR
jgi:hypothetical protein